MKLSRTVGQHGEKWTRLTKWAFTLSLIIIEQKIAYNNKLLYYKLKEYNTTSCSLLLSVQHIQSRSYTQWGFCMDVGLSRSFFRLSIAIHPYTFVRECVRFLSCPYFIWKYSKYGEKKMALLMGTQREEREKMTNKMDSMRRVHNQTTVCRFDLQHYARCCSHFVCCFLSSDFPIRFWCACVHFYKNTVHFNEQPSSHRVGIFGLVSLFTTKVFYGETTCHSSVSRWCVLSINALSECFDFLFMFLWSCYNIFNSSLSLRNFGWRRRRMIPNAQCFNTQWNTFTIIAIEAFSLLVFGDDVRLIWWWLRWFTVFMCALHIHVQ